MSFCAVSRDPIDVSTMEDGDVYTPGDDPRYPMMLWPGHDLHTDRIRSAISSGKHSTSAVGITAG